LNTSTISRMRSSIAIFDDLTGDVERRFMADYGPMCFAPSGGASSRRERLSATRSGQSMRPIADIQNVG